MSKDQKDDLKVLFPGKKNLDYVSCWYKKADEYIEGTKAEGAFVSTNSIVQGETVGRMWEDIGLIINFAYRTFVWDSEAVEKAHVHCVIIGFAKFNRPQKMIFDHASMTEVQQINHYLVDGPDVLVMSRNKPLCDVQKMIYGNKPADGGCLIVEADAYGAFLKDDPGAKKFLHPLLGAREYLHGEKRWCIWLKGVAPSEIKKHPGIYERVRKCRENRLQSKAAGIRKFADTPMLFAQITQPDDVDFLIVPRVSSQMRRYIPIGFMKAGTIVSDRVQIVPNATLYTFGILISNVHMAWMRLVAMRLKSDYSYSKDIVYNNFPWPTPTPAQRTKIEQTAQGILDARALYPDSSLADLYDEVLMPKELRDAHRKNDRAVMEAYGFWGRLNTESDCVAELMKMYQSLVEESEKQKR